MEWLFCPRCETELQGEHPACPACGYDPDEVVEAPDPDDGTSYSEKYRELTYVAAVDARRPRRPIRRTRLLVAIALLAVAGLYASIVLVSDMRARAGGPPEPRGRITAPR